MEGLKKGRVEDLPVLDIIETEMGVSGVGTPSHRYRERAGQDEVSEFKRVTPVLPTKVGVVYNRTGVRMKLPNLFFKLHDAPPTGYGFIL